MRLAIVFAAVAAVTGSCSYAAPDIATVPQNPTYENDVKPLLANHCLLCHSSPAKRRAPSYFRLDNYEDKDGILGAKSMAAGALDAVKARRMPPAAKDGDGVGPNGLRLFETWVAFGAPEKPPADASP